MRACKFESCFESLIACYVRLCLLSVSCYEPSTAMYYSKLSILFPRLRLSEVLSPAPRNCRRQLTREMSRRQLSIMGANWNRPLESCSTSSPFSSTHL